MSSTARDEQRRRRGVTLTAGAAAAVGIGAATRRAVTSRAAELTARPGRSARSVDLGPVTTHQVEAADGARLAVREAGDPANPTLLLVHGLTNQWWIWATVAAELVETHHLVIPDLRGHGDSTLGERGIALDAVADDLAAIVEQLDLRDVTVAGYSMGGMAVLRLAVDRPTLLEERVERLVLIATSAAIAALGVREGGAIRTSPWVAPSYQLQARVPVLKPAYGRAPLWTVLLGAAAYSDQVSGPAVEDMLAMHAASRSEVTAQAMRAMTQQDVRDQLDRITVPVTVVVGSDDVTIGPAHSRAIVEGIADARLVLVDGARHGVVLERPQQVAEILADRS